MFFFFLLAILLVTIIAVHTSRIGIEVEDLVIDTEQKEKLSKESKIWIYLILFKKIKLFKKNVLEMKRPNLKIESKNIEIQVIKALKNIDVDI